MTTNVKNKGAFMDRIDHMIIKEIPVPEITTDQVLIKVEYVGICGSDVHYFHDGRCGTFVVEDKEFMLGHECAGTVIAVGSEVTHLTTGDRVCVEPGITCGKCEFCKSGRYNLCPDVKFLATPPVQGCYERYLAFPADLCYRLPKNISTRVGALIEPLSTCMYSAQLGEVTVGDTVVILGAGCIGLLILMCCKARGASKVIVCDLESIRLDKAKELGADYVINGREKDLLAEINRITGNRGADVVFEAAGNSVTIAQTPHVVCQGGLIVLVGMAAEEEITYNFGLIMAKEARIKSQFRFVNTFPKAIASVESGLIPLEKIITHEYSLDQIQDAFEACIYDKSNVVKAIIKID
ncbi:NAD(P)-dependent alcohol dehydrogenase [Apibacter sp. HY039]|uniref:NAD(P)-dependent alcohol dehydrogenase n=1 Tax=Apibacter sp. HY039 TaxID=2501476 RepID=UPI000FEBFFD8|nr:NAD(P)-dependent alcohol dehydrogenase [Apibacter sp. HY039]